MDAFVSTTYYSRIRFVMLLLQLLTASPLPGHAISIYAGGFEDGTSPGELPIGCPPPSTYGVSGVRKPSCFMKTFLFEELARRHAGHLRLSHIYPGLVDGPAFLGPDIPTWFKLVWRLLKPVMSLYMTSSRDCGDVMVSLASSRYPARGAKSQDKSNIADVAKGSDGADGSGCYTLGQRGDSQNVGLSYERVRQEDTAMKIWEHTMEALDRVVKDNAAKS